MRHVLIIVSGQVDLGYISQDDIYIYIYIYIYNT